MANPLTGFKSEHHVIVGLTLTTVGVLGVIGSVTGRLAPMIAGLFDPSDLKPSGGSGLLGTNATTPIGAAAATAGNVATAAASQGQNATGLAGQLGGLAGTVARWLGL